MNTIYLLAGHSLSEPGAINKYGTREAELTIELRDMVGTALKKHGIAPRTDHDRDTLSAVTARLLQQSREGDIICDLHFNAFNKRATGTEAIVPQQPTSRELQLAAELCSTLSAIMKIPDRGVKKENDSARGRLAIMRPNGINILLEVCFMDNENDIAAYKSNKQHVAASIANLLKEYCR